ncbi:MAG: VWA domain-containing protein [Chlorobi bacterium]|nr:VWA domain-containing protein [Chlorobiota bacterium]
MIEPDQLLFKKIVNLVKRFNKQDPLVLKRTVKLEAISGRLALVASALCGNRIEVLEAEQEGGLKGNLFYLPTQFDRLDSLEANLKFYFFRTVFLSVQYLNKINLESANHDLGESRKEAKDKANHIIEEIRRDYPSIFEFYQKKKHLFDQESEKNENIPDFWLYGKLMFAGGTDATKKDTNADDAAKSDQRSATEVKSKAVEDARVINVDKKTQEDYVLTHNFEKVDTAEEFNGVWRSFDGDDSLEKDAEALNELNLRYMVRTDDEVHSVYQADFRDINGIAESKDKDEAGLCVLYDEWNYKTKSYKTDYCKVFLKSFVGNDISYASKTLKENATVLNGLRKKFSQIHQKRQATKRLPDGEEIDIDAVINLLTDIKSGHTPNENIYISKRKKESDISIMFLLDFSLSTDSYAAGNRILDIEKQAVILFGQVLSEYGIDFSIGGFYSKTRNNCTFISIKDFKDDWIKAKRNIGAIEPKGYTRIGPGLRHSNTLLKKQDNKNKWLILLSDGKPNDYDVYEGKYGISDIKQALRELHESQVNTYAIAIESTAKYYLPQMFGQNHYNILSNPNMLLHSLTTLYKRIQNQ